MILAYGSGSSQTGELLLPDGAARFPVAVVLHGGFWRARFGRDLISRCAATSCAGAGRPSTSPRRGRPPAADPRSPCAIRRRGLGVAPLHTRFADVWDAVDRLRRLVAAGEHRRVDASRGRVT